MTADVEVHLDHEAITLFAGTACFTRQRGRVSTTFVHDPASLEAYGAPTLDPRIATVTGRQYIPALPGAFGDGAPDRWGRGLISCVPGTPGSRAF